MTCFSNNASTCYPLKQDRGREKVRHSSIWNVQKLKS